MPGQELNLELVLACMAVHTQIAVLKESGMHMMDTMKRVTDRQNIYYKVLSAADHAVKDIGNAIKDLRKAEDICYSDPNIARYLIRR